MKKAKKGARKPEDTLPKTAKRNGKKYLAGRPLDPDEDFATPAKKPQEEMFSKEETNSERPTVLEGKMLVIFLKPIYSKPPKRDREIALQMSMPLSDLHMKGRTLDPKIKKAWDTVSEGDANSVDLGELDPRRVEIFLAPDIKKPELDFHVARIAACKVGLVQKRGEGEARRMVRLLFRVQVPVNKQVSEFADNSYPNPFWISFSKTNEELPESEEE